MIRRLPKHLNLGLRPSGLYELVDTATAEVSFVPSDPGGEPIDILVNPNDVPFSERPRSFLTDLRNERATLLENHRKARRRGKKNDTPRTPTRRKSKPRLALVEDSKLTTLFTSDTAALLRERIAGLSNGNGAGRTKSR